MQKALAAVLLGSCIVGMAEVARGQNPSVLVYTRNGPTLDGKKGYVHDNIPACVAMLQQLGRENGFDCDVTERPDVFTDSGLKKYRVIIFANSNNRAFDTAEQRAALQRFVRAGGGVVGIHSACASERDWPWFWAMMGGTFLRHPKLQPFTIYVVDRKHPSTAHLGPTWEWEDEFYFLKEMPKNLHILLEGDLTKLKDPKKDPNEKTRPLAWCHEFEGGRVWFTALGHKKEHYSDPNLQKHILGGIQWVMTR
ncbi:MAG: ThuA domain-containing protein [Verrucomicrobiae bacterium]|nr:ThuA domain-containing protein [Verrucomicrobiae bacterium]